MEALTSKWNVLKWAITTILSVYNLFYVLFIVKQKHKVFQLLWISAKAKSYFHIRCNFFLIHRPFLLRGSWVRARWEELPDCRRCSSVVPNQELHLCTAGDVQNARAANCTECNPAGYLQKMVIKLSNFYFFFFKQKSEAWDLLFWLTKTNY